jgi:DNA repair photolyase
MLRELGYKYLLIDSEIISQIFEEGYFSELQTFSKFGRIFILGAFKPKIKTPFLYSFIKLPSKIKEPSKDVISKIRENKNNSLELYKILNLPKTKIKSEVLYIKKTRESVLTNIAKLYNLDFETCREKRDCDLRLATYGMENCPHQCIYCFANYNWGQPTILLFDFDKKLQEDLNKPELRKIIKQGWPIHVGSIMDFGSKLSIFFKQIHKALRILKGKNIFIGTKSPLIARDDVIKAIKKHSRAEIVFTYTGLRELEPNLPQHSRNFPYKSIKKLTSNKIRVILLYKPIIPGLNDKEEEIRKVFRKAKEAGVTEISTGFLKMNYRFQKAIKVNSPRYYKYFKKVLSEQVEETDFLPSYRYRIAMAKKLRKICDKLNLRISFCQPFIGDLKSKLANSLCPCRKERWK